MPTLKKITNPITITDLFKYGEYTVSDGDKNVEIYYLSNTNENPKNFSVFQYPREETDVEYQDVNDFVRYINAQLKKGRNVQVFTDSDAPHKLFGFKTATYGRKPHRDNITQLENSVRRMF